jgi:hypothetical protein
MNADERRFAQAALLPPIPLSLRKPKPPPLQLTSNVISRSQVKNPQRSFLASHVTRL